jgi:DNA-binding CsgD family transcriptional regulator
MTFRARSGNLTFDGGARLDVDRAEIERMHSLGPEALSRTIGDIYDCALDVSRWEETLIGLTDAVDAAYSMVGLTDKMMGSPRVMVHSPWNAATFAAADNRFTLRDVPGLDQVLLGDIDIAQSTLNQMSREQLKAKPFYQQWLQPQGLSEGVSVKFMDTADRMGLFLFVTRDTRETVGETERRFLTLLSPHVRRAALISDLLNFDKTIKDYSVVAMAGLATPVILTDENSLIIFANPLSHLALRDAIARAATCGIDLGQRGIGLPISNANNTAAVAYVLPIRPGSLQTRSGRRAAAVFIASSVSRPPPEQEILSTIFDLTPAEARVMLSLARGRTVVETAVALNVSPNTVKTQLARIFLKTGTNRQQDLIKLVDDLGSPAVTAVTGDIPAVVSAPARIGDVSETC